MTKKPEKKTVNNNTKKPDYFKLPFEVFYSEHVPVTMLEFKSDIAVENFEDIKIVHKEQGQSLSPSFLCAKNNGPELYCCIYNSHDEVDPKWLEILDEENVDMDFGEDLAVKVENDEIIFSQLTENQEDEESEEYLDIDNMDQCCSWSFFAYELGDSSPDYIILDANESRIKVNLDGFVIDDEGNETEERIFNPEELDWEELENYTTQEMWEAKFDWVKSTLEKDFPKQINLKLSLHTE